MTVSRLVVFACTVALAIATAMAQESPRLLFEVTIDGSVVAKPEMRVPSGGEGRIELHEKHGALRVAFTPAVRGDDVAIAFDITDGNRQFRPTLVVTTTVPGSIEWTSSVRGQAIRVGVSLVR
jgi:hypothetical protein